MKIKRERGMNQLLNGMINLDRKTFEHEVTFSFRFKTLNGGVKGFKDAWRIGVLHVEYERLKEIQK